MFSKLSPVFLLWAGVLIVLWLLFAIAGMFMDTQPLEWFMLVPIVLYGVHAAVVMREAKLKRDRRRAELSAANSTPQTDRAG
jgi:hypothetical protein